MTKWFNKAALVVAAALTIGAIASESKAVILYNANVTTGTIGSFVGDPDSFQVIQMAPLGAPVLINSFPVMGVRYNALPTVNPQIVIRFYSGYNLAAGAFDDVLGSATLINSIAYSLPITGVNANTSYNFNLPGVNIVVPAQVGVRVTFFTDNTFTQVTDGTNGPVGRLSTGTPTVGAASPVTFIDDNITDGIFTGGEGYVAQSSPLVPLNIRMSIDATIVPEPSALGLLAPAAMLLGRRRK